MNSIKAVASTSNEAVINDYLGLGWVYLNSVAVGNLTGPNYVVGWDKSTEPQYPHESLKPMGVKKPTVRR